MDGWWTVNVGTVEDDLYVTVHFFAWNMTHRQNMIFAHGYDIDLFDQTVLNSKLFFKFGAACCFIFLYNMML